MPYPAGQQSFLANGVIPCINTAPAGNAGLGWPKPIDLRLGWAHKTKDRVTLQPSVTFYNAFNFANFDGPADLPGGVLGGAAGFNINNSAQSIASEGGDAVLAPHERVRGHTPASQPSRSLEVQFRISYRMKLPLTVIP